MTVKELIEELMKIPNQNAEVVRKSSDRFACKILRVTIDKYGRVVIES